MIESTKYKDEQAIIHQLRMGEGSAISNVYKDNYQLIEQFVLNNNGIKADAKDLYQEVFMIFIEKLKEDSFSLTCLISTYLYSVARFQWLKKLKKRKSGKVVALLDNAEYLENIPDGTDEIDLEEQTSKNEQIAMHALEQLGNPCKKLLQYFYFHKRTMENIAKEMNYKSGKAARNQKYKCMERLRKAVALQV